MQKPAALIKDNYLKWSRIKSLAWDTDPEIGFFTEVTEYLNKFQEKGNT